MKAQLTSCASDSCFSGFEEEPAAAEEEAEEAEAPAEAEADAPVGDPEVTEEEITSEEAAGDAEEPAQEETDGGEEDADAGETARSAGAVSESNDSGSGTVVGVVCGIAVAAIGAITGYFTYQKKKLCFKVQRGDPESAKEENGTQSDPQVLNTLLNSS
uniref:Uncharacterized protein n=1 Tax=Sinocyclocheilus anshuiensis TaxID=1608454 RepID=A0A671QKQ9_9TELE